MTDKPTETIAAELTLDPAIDCWDFSGIAQPARTDDSAIEQEIQAKGKTAPRIMSAGFVANIVSEHYFRASDGVNGETGGTVDLDWTHPLGRLTVCVLVLRNGVTVTGECACASPENFDAEIGRKIARQNAVNKVMGYALKAQLHATAGEG